jgi:hypothetical protein
MSTSVYQFNEKMVPGFLAGFDSTSAMLTLSGNYLRGDDLPGPGIIPPVNWILKEAGKLTRKTRETIYSLSGFMHAVSPENLGRIKSEQISNRVVSKYPKRQFPAIAIGSTNGALLHLQTALLIPWLPQTFLIPVRRPPDIHVDDPKSIMEWAREPAGRFLGYNPDLRLHHMFDPNMDRLMLEYMTCFRVKKLRLGAAYERFIRDTLRPGGTILVQECQKKWPVTTVDNRHLFQFGSADGGATKTEYFEGGDRVEKYLHQHNSPFSRWDPPAADYEGPEAEWGFDPALYEDIERLAKEGGYKVKRIVYEDPDHPSPFVAELFRWWYKQRRIIANRLLVSTFTRIDPYRTFRTGSVPYWTRFSAEAQAKLLEEYLKDHGKYDEIYLMRYIHGIEGIGFADAGRWQQILANAAKRGEILGYGYETDSIDLALVTGSNAELENTIVSRYAVPGPLGFGAFSGFIEESRGKFRVEFFDDTPAKAKPASETPKATAIVKTGQDHEPPVKRKSRSDGGNTTKKTAKTGARKKPSVQSKTG